MKSVKCVELFYSPSGPVYPVFEKRKRKNMIYKDLEFCAGKGNLLHTRKNLKNRQNFTPFRVNKMFSLKF
jgi:hypothetical protein